MFKMTILILALIAQMSVSAARGLKQATFAGGCFWCMEPPFEKLAGVKSVISGFAGGEKKSPTYKEVASGKTSHLEAVQVTYDPTIISYTKLLKVFWKNIDPTDSGGQFVDRGHQYSTAVFYHNKEQQSFAEKSKKYIRDNKFFEKRIVTPIRSYNKFYPAEDYHQDFYKKSLFSKARYKYYRAASGRDQFIEKYWKGKKIDFLKSNNKKIIFKKPGKEKLKEQLSELQYKVTQEDGTEQPFKNEYWDNKEEGIYVDVVSGEALFSSKDKYDSGSGWPAFTKPLVKQNIEEKEDSSLFRKRVEVRSKGADSHLGHVFEDGPKESTGLRYCINSASLKFIKKDDLEKEGHGKFLKDFSK